VTLYEDAYGLHDNHVYTSVRIVLTLMLLLILALDVMLLFNVRAVERLGLSFGLGGIT